MNRRTFLKGATASAAVLRCAQPTVRGRKAEVISNQSGISKRKSEVGGQTADAIRKEVAKRHDEAVHRLQQWIHQPSIAAENRGVSEGCDFAMRLLRE